MRKVRQDLENTKCLPSTTKMVINKNGNYGSKWKVAPFLP